MFLGVVLALCNINKTPALLFLSTVREYFCFATIMRPSEVISSVFQQYIHSMEILVCTAKPDWCIIRLWCISFNLANLNHVMLPKMYEVQNINGINIIRSVVKIILQILHDCFKNPSIQTPKTLIRSNSIYRGTKGLF